MTQTNRPGSDCSGRAKREKDREIGGARGTTHGSAGFVYAGSAPGAASRGSVGVRARRSRNPNKWDYRLSRNTVLHACLSPGQRIALGVPETAGVLHPQLIDPL